MSDDRQPTPMDARVLAQMIWAFWDELRVSNDRAADVEQMPLEMRMMLTYQFHHAMTTGDDED